MRTAKDPIEFLRVVAKKKPHLQELLDNVSTMTLEEIDQLGEALWIRQALKKCKEDYRGEQQMYVAARLARVIAAEEEAAKLPQRTYEVRIWDCTSTFIGGNGHSNHHQWKIEMDDGDSFMIFDDELVRVGDAALKISDFERTPLMQGSKFVGYMTLENYKGFHRALLNQKHKL